MRTSSKKSSRRGFSLVEVTVSSGLLVLLSVQIANTWVGLGRPLLETIYRCRIAEEAHMALSCLARDLGGCLPGDEGASGRKNQNLLVGRTQPGGSELWLCFDGSSSPNGSADWLAPDTVISYALVDNALVRTNQADGTEYVVARHVEGFQVSDVGGGEVTIDLTFACRGTTQSYTLVAKDP